MKRSFVWGVTVFGVVGSLLWGAYDQGYLSFPMQPVVAATAPTVAAQPAALTAIIADAKVVPVLSADLSSTSSGVAVDVPIREGAQVTPGQLLVQLDREAALVAVAQAQANLMSAQAQYEELQAGVLPEEIEAARAAVAAAQARLDKISLSTANGDLAAAQATVAQAQANLQGVLAGPSEEQLIAARANLAAAEADRTRAQSAYNQIKWRNDIGATQESAALQKATISYEAALANLADLENGATQSQIGSASAQVRQAQAQLNALTTSRPADIAIYTADLRNAQAQLDKLLRGTRPEVLRQAEANVAAATAALQQQLVALGKLELRSPFTGTVAAVEVTLGEQVSPGAPILRLADLSELQLETEDLTELQVVAIAEGDQAQVTFDALPDLTLNATVVRIRPYGENSAGDIVYRATLALPTADPRLRWNMTAAVTFGGE